MKAIVALTLSTAAVSAFTSSSVRRSIQSKKLTLSSSFLDENDSYDRETQLMAKDSNGQVPQQEQGSYSLEGSEFAGNWGFDPLGLAQTKDNLWTYREAEIKHARLAMLAALGWPLSEALNRPIADALGLPSVLDEASRAPSLLNGGLDSISPVWWGCCLGVSAAIDMYGTAKARANDPEYTPGKLGFDPLHLYPANDRDGQRMLELAEISNGRLAMIAITAFALQEYISQVGFVEEAMPLLGA